MGENREVGSKLLYFLAGSFVGAAVALLFAPRSGEETRELLASKGRKLKDQASSYVEKGKETLNKQKEQIAQALEAGRQAYGEEKNKPE